MKFKVFVSHDFLFETRIGYFILLLSTSLILSFIVSRFYLRFTDLAIGNALYSVFGVITKGKMNWIFPKEDHNY